MKNVIDTLPLDQLETGKVAHATFHAKGTFYTFAPDLDSSEFLRLYPDHKRIQGILGSSGSSWLSGAYIFFTADCFDPPVYLQVGSSFDDAYESYVDNDESLIIPPEDYKDYDVEGDSPTCGFNSDGQPVNTESVQGFEVTLTSVSFEH